MKVSDIVARMRLFLIDPSGNGWTDPELVGHINSAIQEIATVDEPAYSVNEPLTCVAGTKQTLPKAALTLIDVRRNLGSNGEPGRAITTVRLADMDAARPGWHGDTPAPIARHEIADAREDRVFYLWPPMVAGSKVEVVYHGAPPTVAAGDDIPFADSYGPAIFLMAVAYAYGKNTKRADLAKFTGYRQQALQLLGVDSSVAGALHTGEPDA